MYFTFLAVVPGVAKHSLGDGVKKEISLEDADRAIHANYDMDARDVADL